MPQWLELSWPEPIALSEIHLTFDSGFPRPLCLTQSDGFNARMVRGPQPETVRDYELLARSGGQWRSLVKVRGNYQRQRVHKLEAQMVEALRLEVEATNGDPSARIFEIRVY